MFFSETACTRLSDILGDRLFLFPNQAGKDCASKSKHRSHNVASVIYARTTASQISGILHGLTSVCCRDKTLRNIRNMPKRHFCSIIQMFTVCLSTRVSWITHWSHAKHERSHDSLSIYPHTIAIKENCYTCFTVWHVTEIENNTQQQHVNKNLYAIKYEREILSTRSWLRSSKART